MAKKKGYADSSPLDEPTNVTSEPAANLTMQEVDAAVYGRIDIPETGNQVAKPLPLQEIYPDLTQPRRAIPITVRGQWDGDPDDLPAILGNWHLMARKASPVDIDVVKLLMGVGDPAGSDERNPVVDEYLELIALAASIHRDGLVNPITVTAQGGQYVIETGERRVLAHWLLAHFVDSGKYEKIAARLVDKSDVWRQAAENGVRRPLFAVGMARQLALLIMDMYRDDPGEKFMFYRDMVLPGEVDRKFYAQVANGNAYPVKPGMSQRILDVTGLKNVARIAEHRSLLRVPDEVWVEADTDNWTLGGILAHLDTLKPAVAVSQGDNTFQNWKVLPDAVTEPEPPDEDKPDSRVMWWEGKQVTWQAGNQNMKGQVAAVYKASNLPRPGAVMLQVKGGDGVFHQVEAENARLAKDDSPEPAASIAAPVSNPIGYTAGDMVVITGYGAFGKGKKGIVQKVDQEQVQVNLYTESGKLSVSIVNYLPAQLSYERLPEAQDKMLLQIYHGDSIDPKNAATRMALKEKGMIFITSSEMWMAALKNKGNEYLRQYALISEHAPDDDDEEEEEVALPAQAVARLAATSQPASADNPLSARSDTPEIRSGDKVWIISSPKPWQLNVLWTVDGIDTRSLATLSIVIGGEVVKRVYQYVSNLRLDDAAQPHAPAPSPDGEGEQDPEPLPAQTPPPAPPRIQGGEEETLPPAAQAWDAHPIVMLGSEMSLMLKWLSHAAQATHRAEVDGAIKRLLAASPAEVAKFVSVNGAQRYTEMLQNEYQTVLMFTKEVVQTLDDVCQLLHEKALEIEQESKA